MLGTFLYTYRLHSRTGGGGVGVGGQGGEGGGGAERTKGGLGKPASGVHDGGFHVAW